MNTELRLLIIDDDELDRETSRRLLGRMPYLNAHIFEATDVAEALEILKPAKRTDEESPGIDLILLDYHLGAHNGLQAIRILKNQDIQTPVIMLTGQGSERVAVETMEAGALDYLVKDQLSISTLQRAIANTLLKSEMRALIDRQKKSLMDAERQRAMIESLSAACAHFSQPLSSMIAYLELLISEGPKISAKEQKRMLTECLHSARQMSDLLNRFRQVREYRGASYLENRTMLDIGVNPVHSSDDARTLEITEKAERQGDDLSGQADPESTSLHVMIVDPDPARRARVGAELAQIHRWRVIHQPVSTLDEALWRLNENKGKRKVDVILADIENKAYPMTEIIERLSQEDRFSVVAVADRGGEEIAAEAMRAGATEYTRKENINAGELARIISNVLDKQKLKREIEQQEFALIQAERTRVTLESVAATSHHFSQPLTVMLSNLDSLVNEAAMIRDERREKMLRQCLQATAMLKDLIGKFRRLNVYRTRSYLNDRRMLDIEPEGH